TLRVRPEGVPGGIFTETVPPSSSGTDTVVPSTASSKATGTVILRFAPSALHTGCSSTSRVSRRPPAGAPPGPGRPLPRRRDFWPSGAPAGNRGGNEPPGEVGA